MRRLMILILLSTTGYAQTMLETSAAAAGGSVGGVAGKKLGEGIAGIFNKVDKTAAKAAKTAVSPTGSKSASSDTLMEVGPGVPKSGPSVPPPPPVHRAAARKVARTRVAEPPPSAPIPPVALAAPPPAPQVTKDDLRKVSAGMDRDGVLQLGQPAERITMFEDGHLLEIYRYMAKDITIGAVRLVDGAVATVQMP